MTTSDDVAIIGGGPAGLTAAYELQKVAPERGITVYEAAALVGGISRTESYKGFRFDIGGHRFFTKVPEVEAMWREVLGDDFIEVQRLSRIYYRGQFYSYPLKLMNALGNIGPVESVRIMLSYLRWQIRPHRKEDSFEEWVVNRFGARLYMHFFETYTEKVWGIPPRDIRADWAAQRIKNLSLMKAVWNALSGANDTASLIETFRYPRLGPGMMWERTADLVTEAGGAVRMNTRVERVHREGMRVTAIDIDGPDGPAHVPVREVVNSMPVRELLERLDPPPPAEVMAAAKRLKYRDFLIVTLILDSPDPFPDNWIYIHSPEVQVGRIQNFRAWSPEMMANDSQASIGMEYFCHDTDDLWATDDDALVRLGARELAQLGLAREEDVVGGTVIRQPKAYPVYDTEYREALDVIEGWIKGFENLQTVGRNGLHRYNNQDHSMLSAMFAARNIAGADLDVWDVNVERSYHEEFQRDEGKPVAA